MHKLTPTRASAYLRLLVLQVWAIGTTAEAAATSQLVRSHYVYESVRCMAVNWAASPPVVAVGAASGERHTLNPLILRSGSSFLEAREVSTHLSDDECCDASSDVVKLPGGPAAIELMAHSPAASALRHKPE